MQTLLAFLPSAQPFPLRVPRNAAVPPSWPWWPLADAHTASLRRRGLRFNLPLLRFPRGEESGSETVIVIIRSIQFAIAIRVVPQRLEVRMEKGHDRPRLF